MKKRLQKWQPISWGIVADHDCDIETPLADALESYMRANDLNL